LQCQRWCPLKGEFNVDSSPKDERKTPTPWDTMNTEMAARAPSRSVKKPDRKGRRMRKSSIVRVAHGRRSVGAAFSLRLTEKSESSEKKGLHGWRSRLSVRRRSRKSTRKSLVLVRLARSREKTRAANQRGGGPKGEGRGVTEKEKAVR
jgi:hypothetical protein